MLLNKHKLLHWLATVLLAWALYFLLLGIPIFHFCLAVSITKIASFAGIACVVQLAITPWLFSARVTPQNPNGKLARRTVAVIVWFTLFAVQIFCFAQHGWSRSSHSQVLRGVFFDAAMVAIVDVFIIIDAISRYRRNSVSPKSYSGGTGAGFSN